MKKKFIFAIATAMISLLTFSACSATSENNEPSEDQPQSDIVVETATVDGIEMPYAKFGRGSKNLVIIPGLSFKPVTGSAEAVAASYASFTDEYTVWLFDIRSNAPDQYSVENMANDTATVMKSLGIESADFFGASLGGMITQYIAVDSPELVNKMILGSSMCRNNDVSTASILRWNNLASISDVDALVSQCVDDMYSQATLDAYRDTLIAANSDLTEEQLATFANRTYEILHFDVSAELSKVTCPVLVLGCEGDNVLGAQASREIAEILGCEIYMYPAEYSHCVYDEAPDYKDRMHAFLSQK